MLKIIACLTMLADHIGVAFFPNESIFRMIGRLAMPIYAYHIASGFHFTKNLKKYCIRILLIALVSQVPFMILTQSVKLNICFVWLAGFGLLYYADKKKYIPAACILVISWFVPFDYGTYALIWVLFFYCIRNHEKYKIDAFILLSILTALYIVIFKAPYYQFLALLSVVLIYICENAKQHEQQKRQFQSAYRYFYPVHLMIIDVIQMLCGI